jgi:hypothetical protein
VIPERYPLRETPSEEYSERTRWNVRDSDGTLVVVRGAFGGGTALTVEAVRELGKPCLVADLASPPPIEAVVAWLRTHGICILNVAGPRESQNPGIRAVAAEFLQAVFAETLGPDPNSSARTIADQRR